MEKVYKLKPIDEFSEKYFFDGDLFKEGVLLPVPEGVNLEEEMEHASARQLATHAKSGTLVYAVGHSLVILNKKGLVKLVDQVKDKKKQSTRPALSSFQKEGLGICINFQSSPKSEPIKERIRNFRLSDGSSSQVYIAVEFDKEIIVSDYLQMLKGSSSEQIYSIASPSGFIRYFQEGGDIIALTKEGKFVCNSKPTEKVVEDAVTHLNAQTKGAFRCSFEVTQLTTLKQLQLGVRPPQWKGMVTDSS